MIHYWSSKYTRCFFVAYCILFTSNSFSVSAEWVIALLLPVLLLNTMQDNIKLKGLCPAISFQHYIRHTVPSKPVHPHWIGLDSEVQIRAMDLKIHASTDIYCGKQMEKLPHYNFSWTVSLQNFGRGYGPVARQINTWTLNWYMLILLSVNASTVIALQKWDVYINSTYHCFIHLRWNL
jgi:hypothetical protein